MRRDGDERRALAKVRRDPRPHVLDPDLGDVPLREHDDGRALRLAARRRRPRGPGRRRPRSRRRGRARRRRARPPRARGAPSSTRSPAAGCRFRRRPAVSTSTNVVSPRRRTVSIASRVVPGTSDTMTRSRPSERVQERRLADVRTPEDRDLDRLLADRPLAATREPAHDLVEQVARAVPVQRRDRDRVAEAEPVELERLEVAPRVVELVREHEHGASATRAGSPRAPRRPA